MILAPKLVRGAFSEEEPHYGNRSERRPKQRQHPPRPGALTPIACHGSDGGKEAPEGSDKQQSHEEDFNLCRHVSPRLAVFLRR